ncbi:MAG: VOC family protein [Micromonosporaceae bacterium]
MSGASVDAKTSPGGTEPAPVALTQATGIEQEEPEVVDMKLEVVVVPVVGVDRAKAFYKALGWREDADYAGGADFRVVQLTPPGSACSIIFGTGVTSAAPGSVQGLHLVVTDIEAARAELAACGAEMSEVFHDAGGVFHHAGAVGRVAGAAPDHRSYGSFASFSDPDGNGWRRAAAAHGQHEEQIGHPDPDWPAWYAQCMVQEQAGRPGPARPGAST